MAACVVVNEFGALMASVTPVGECTTYVMQDASDYLTNSVFNKPSPQELAGYWSAGFILPMTVGLIAWAVAKLVNFFNHD